jgi:hypothetical protein
VLPFRRRQTTTAILALSLAVLPPAAVAQPTAQAAHASPATFAGDWGGHGRSLMITKSGKAHVSVNDGCCDTLIKFDFKLSHPRGSGSRAAAKVVVTKVQILDERAFTKGGGSLKAPKVGQVGTLRLRSGVITDPYLRITFCDSAQGMKGTCGA